MTNLVEVGDKELDALRIRVPRRGRGVYSRGLKRIFDFFLVLAAMPFVLPFIALVALLIATDGSAPFFRQERVGQHGRRFLIWKFRTMVPDAEALLATCLASSPEAQREWDAKQKLSNDPRCTAIGRVLRRTSMDELPQLLNVLTGEMSLVGPRPMLPNQQSLYPGHAYYRLRPGITGSWQVSARNESEFQSRALYDDQYATKLSFLTDLKILARTVVVVLRRTGV